MKIRVNWNGYYCLDEKRVELTDFTDVFASTVIEALHSAKSVIIEKLAIGDFYKLENVHLQLLEGERLGLASADELNDYIQNFNVEGGTDSVNRVRPKGYTVTIMPDGTAQIKSGYAAE